MLEHTSTLMIRVKTTAGQSRYFPVVMQANGRVRPYYARVNGQPQHYPDGQYYLRYTGCGKRVTKTIGTDPVMALTAKCQRDHLLEGEDLGVHMPARGGLSSTPTPVGTVTSAKIDLAVDAYLNEVKLRRADRTYKSYARALLTFTRSCTKTYVHETKDVPRCTARRRSPSPTVPPTSAPCSRPARPKCACSSSFSWATVRGRRR